MKAREMSKERRMNITLFSPLATSDKGLTGTNVHRKYGCIFENVIVQERYELSILFSMVSTSPSTVLGT